MGARATHGRDPVGPYAADGEDRNRAVANRLAQTRQALGLAVVGFGGGEIHRSEDHKIGSLGGRDFVRRMGRDTDQFVWAEQLASCADRKRGVSQVDPVSTSRQGHVEAVVNQQPGRVTSGEVAQPAGQPVQLPALQVFLA